LLSPRFPEFASGEEEIMMNRRIVPTLFCVGILLSVVLLFGDRVRAARPPDRVPNLVGTWDGFYQSAGDGGAVGVLRSDITKQEHRRIVGSGVLLDLEGRSLFNTINFFRGTVVRDDFITGNGANAMGRLVFQADLETYAPQPRVSFQTLQEAGLENDGGNAGVLYPEYRFVRAKGRENRISAVLLHPFPVENPPDLAGSWTGSFKSNSNPTFLGGIEVEIGPLSRGTFPGHVVFSPRSAKPFTWPFVATTSSEGRVLMIAQGRTGRILYDGIVLPANESKPTFVGGFYRLMSLEGRLDFGAINFTVNQ
jgi:hypothetical protein